MQLIARCRCLDKCTNPVRLGISYAHAFYGRRDLYFGEQAVKALISINEFLETYGLSRSTVYRLNAQGKIRFVHVGRAVRIPSEDVSAWYDEMLKSGH